MDKPLPSHPDVDALAAGVVATPDDFAAWAPYIDACVDYGLDDWAELAHAYLSADGEGRGELLAKNLGKWPLGDALAAAAFGRAAKFVDESASQLVESFLCVGVAVGRAMTPVVEAMRRIGERMQEPESPGHPDQPPATSGL
jgi:hypothetical protein